jgi:YD repeat-containing protein
VKPILLILLVSTSLCFGADRFQLQSELHANFDENGATTQTLTGYTYDANGNRVQARIWDGIDSATAPMSSVTYGYNAAGAIAEELLLAQTDTLSIVRYEYNSGNLMAVRTLRKDGAVRFTDSLIYDSQGRNIEEQRISSAGVKTYFNRYTLNAQGKKLSDTLFELVTASYNASQAVLFTYNPDSTVATETQWRLSGAGWYCISTAFMSYTAKTLSSVTTRERDGEGTGMMDSLAYTYDANGNRTKEEDYDAEGILAYWTTFVWRDTETKIVLRDIRRPSNQHFAVSGMHGRITITHGPLDRGEIAVFTLAGKRICNVPVTCSGSVPLQGIFAKGPYVAVFTGNGCKQYTNFTIYN